MIEILWIIIAFLWWSGFAVTLRLVHIVGTSPIIKTNPSLVALWLWLVWWIIPIIVFAWSVDGDKDRP